MNDVSLVSLVIPVRDEADGLADNLPFILERAATEGVAFEAVVVDDGSRDTTASVLAKLAAADPRIRPLHFTRNFGKEAAILAGLEHARGAAVVVIDSDRQHPPEMIPEMISRWRQGFAVVEAVKRDRGDADVGHGVPARLFYRLFRGASGIELSNQTDFKLLDRSVVEALGTLPERRRFFRGLVAWMGFPTARLPFDVPPRSGGTSRWRLRRLFSYALDAIMGFSDLPLRVIGVIGLLVFAAASVAGVIALYQKLAGIALDGFTTVIILLALASGAIMGALGIVGVYLARIHEQVLGRPPYVLRPPPEDHSR